MLVLGKADLIDEDRRAELATAIRTRCWSPRSPGRASRRWSSGSSSEFARTLREVELLIPYEEGGRLAELHELAGDLEREETADGVRVTARAAGRRRRALRARSR